MNTLLAEINRFEEGTVANLEKRQLESTFSALIKETEQLFSKFEIYLSDPSPQALEKFVSLPTKRQTLILDELLSTVQITSDIEIGEEKKFTRAQEIEVLRRFLKRAGWRLATNDLVDLISQGDVVEIYNAEAVQVYRSWSCFRFCSYSLADLLVFDWNTLYERPTFVIERLMEIAPKLFQPRASFVEYDIPEYFITERFEGHNNAFLFKMKYAGSVVDDVTGAPVAFITTGAAKLSDEPKIGLNVSFI